ncbi:MAG: proton-conducting transporter membrane subunit, partial [Mycobacterium leprae]
LLSMLGNTALYAILRFHVVAVGTLGPAFSSHLLLALGLVSLGWAVLFILVQRDFKRLLAYSSVEHMGLICIGVGLGGQVGIFGALLQLIGHAMAKSLLFMTAGKVEHRYHSPRMERIHGVLTTLPVTGPLLVIGTLAITGAPLTGLFLSEFNIVSAGFTTGRAWVAVLVLLGIALAFAGMMLHLRDMLLGEAPHGILVGERFSWDTIPLLLPAVVVVALGLWVPPYLAQVIWQIAHLLGGGV